MARRPGGTRAGSRQPRWSRPSYLSVWVKLHITTRGQLLLLVCGILALLGLDTRRSQAFAMFAFAGAPLLAAGHALLRRRPRALVAGGLPRRLTAGRTLTQAIQVTPDAAHARDPLVLTWPLWPHQGQGVHVEPDEAYVDTRSGAAARVTLRVRAAHRGRFVLPGLALARTDPLGLLCGRPARQPDQAVLVHPPLFAIEEPDLPTGRRYQPGGIPLASSLGDSIEFVGTRDYREGDPLRRIHWRSWARRGRPVVKEYQEEYFSRIALVLDTFLPRRPHAGQSRGFEAAVSTLGSLAASLSRTEEVLDILIAGPEIYELQTGRGLGAIESLLDVLACIEPSPGPPFASLEPHLYDLLARLTTVIVVLLQWDAEREAFVTRLRNLGVSVRGVVVHEGALPASVLAAHAGDLIELTPRQVEQRIEAETRHEVLS